MHFVFSQLGQTIFLKLGMATGLGERKLWIQTKFYRKMGSANQFLLKSHYISASSTTKPGYNISLSLEILDHHDAYITDFWSAQLQLWQIPM